MGKKLDRFYKVTDSPKIFWSMLIIGWVTGISAMYHIWMIGGEHYSLLVGIICATISGIFFRRTRIKQK